MPADVLDNLTDPSQKPRVINGQCPRADAIAVQLACFSNQPSSVGERAHRHRAITGGHAAEVVPRDQCGTRPEARRSERRHDAGRPSADHHYIVGDIVRLGHRAMSGRSDINLDRRH